MVQLKDLWNVLINYALFHQIINLVKGDDRYDKNDSKRVF